MFQTRILTLEMLTKFSDPAEIRIKDLENQSWLQKAIFAGLIIGSYCESKLS